MSGGGRFDFDDGGTFCGGWEDGKAHGYGVCTGPKGQGEYSGAWQNGFEICGIYMWPAGNAFEGQWLQGKRHGLGIESKGRWIYRGEWTQGFKGRYGSRHSTASGAKYEGTWTTGLQDGYGVETYADGGTYQGQWLRGMRHGYGVRQSVPYGLAAHYRPKAMRESLTSLRSEKEEDNVVKDRDRKIDEGRGGFVLQARSDEEPRRRSIFDKHGRSSLKKSLMSGLKLRKQKSTGDIIESSHTSPRRNTGGSVRSTVSNSSRVSSESGHSAVTSMSQYTDSNLSFVSQDDINDVNVIETYMGEWKNDKRSGFGVSERSDGLRYEGEWYNNKKFGHGVTTFKDGTQEEGKYKNNVLISSNKKAKLFLIRSSKLRERVDNAVSAAQRAAQIALQKADIAISRMANARAKAEQADMAAQKAREDSEVARVKAKEFAPEFQQPGLTQQQPGVSSQMMHAVDGPIQPQHASQNHVGNNVNYSSLDRAAAARNIPKETLDLQPQTQSALSQELPSSYLRNNTSKRNSLQRERPKRFTELLDSTVVNDHFDQYGTLGSQCSEVGSSMYGPVPVHEDSGLGGLTPEDYSPGYSNSDIPMGSMNGAQEPMTPMSPPIPLPIVNNRPQHLSYEQMTPQHMAAHRMTPQRSLSRQPTPTSPEPPPPASSATDRPLSRPLQRRKTLPSIIKRPPTIGESEPRQKAAGASKTSAAKSSSSASTSLKKAEEEETYIIENGVRKRIKAEVHQTPPSPSPSIGHDDDKLKQVPKRYKIEASNLRKMPNRGSLPDVSVCKELKNCVTPREQMSELSHKRRQELIKLQEEEERRRQQEIVLRLSDLKDWCQERQLLMFVIAVNVSLATMFFNILSQ